MAQAFLSERIVLSSGIRSGAVLEEEGRIRAICSVQDVPTGYNVVNMGWLCLLPGFVDSHVHINQPGRTEWEGFWTATQAAAAGGYTTLVDMPLNCLPATTTVQALQAKRAAANAQCFVDWAAWGGIEGDDHADLESLADAGVKGFKCFLIYPGIEGLQMVSARQLESALPIVAQTRLPLLVHAELAGPIDAATSQLREADWRNYDTYLRSRPDLAELEAIRLLLRLAREYRFHLHIVHLATSAALDELRDAKEEGLSVTVETCPHYLHFAAEDIPAGSTLHKCAPPLRSRANREALWQAVRDGIIDLIATDHSPCPPEWKRLEEGRFDQAWGGISSLAVAGSVVWTEMRARGLSLQDLARLMALRPATLAGLGGRKGAIEPGFDADFLVFDPDASITVNPDRLYTRHKLSPYVGETLLGKVWATYLRGQPVFLDGNFPSPPFGVEV